MQKRWLILLGAGALLGVSVVMMVLWRFATISLQKRLDTHLIEAVKHNNAARMKELLKQGASANAPYGSGTVLIHAAFRGHSSAVRVLLNAGADVNATTKTHGASALTMASANGHISAVKVLLNAREINIDHRDNIRGESALMYASRWGYTDTVRVLLARGADATIKNHQGKTALQLAKEGHSPTGKNVPGGHTAVIKLLKQAGKTASSVIRPIPDEPKTYAEVLAAAKRDGIPIEVESLNPPMPPPEQNAAPLYVQLKKLLKEKPLTEVQKSPDRYGYGSAPLTKTQAEEVRQALRERKDVVDLFHQAAARPKFVVHRDRKVHPALVVAEEFPDFASIRNCARWLSAESALLLYDGKPLEAVKVQEMGLTVAQHATGRTVISYLVGVAVDAMSLAGMERILHQAGNDPAVAQAVKEAIERSQPVLHPEEILRNEAPEAVKTLEEIRRLSLKELPDVFEGESLKPPKFTDRAAFDRYVDANGVTFFRLLRQSMAAMKKPYPQAITELKAIDAELESKSHQPEYQIVWMVMTMHGTGIAHHTATIRARSGVLRASAAVLAYKSKQGSYPTTLQEAISDVPEDPFSTKPIPYRVEGNRFIVYSVGSEGNFKGEFDPPTKQRRVFFQYPAPIK